MESADLYIRVSTDKQVQGYSQRNQEERLKKYCADRNIEVRKTIFEDHSAKTFNRPEWKKLYKSWIKDKNQRPTLLLFTQCDRFSRNTAESYFTLLELKKLGIEAQAIDQPIDLSIPDAHILLAVYIAVPEVENMRRSKNVKEGMYKAKKEGRWPGKAPYGYINQTSPDGVKYIAVSEQESLLVQLAFKLVADGPQSARAVHKELSQKYNFRKSFAHFYEMLRNPFYYGKIPVPEYQGNDSYLSTGLHPPIITKELFDQVQKAMSSKSRPRITKKTHITDRLPLRDFLLCPLCNGRLTGSGSKGYTKKYYYYHCIPPCKYRISATIINDLFIEGLKHLKLADKYKKLVIDILKEA